MKKAFKFLCLMCAVFMLSGCYRVNTNVEINSDKSGSIEFVLAVDMKTLKSSMGADSTSDPENMFDVENYDELKNSGWKVEAYKSKEGEKEWEGTKLVYEFDNIDKIVGTKKDAVEIIGNDNEKPDVSNFFYKDGDKYVANQYLDLSSGDTSTATDSMKEMFDFKYTVKLPNKASSNNATKVDGTTYSWDLEYGKKNEIKYEFKFGGSNLVLIICIAAGVVVLGGLAFVFLKKKNK